MYSEARKKHTDDDEIIDEARGCSTINKVGLKCKTEKVQIVTQYMARMFEEIDSYLWEYNKMQGHSYIEFQMECCSIKFQKERCYIEFKMEHCSNEF